MSKFSILFQAIIILLLAVIIALIIYYGTNPPKTIRAPRSLTPVVHGPVLPASRL